jgi:formylmethanofuran dehydrogenase subunit E
MKKNELETPISDAVRLHGHLGPFLVIGVRMGTIANRIFASCSTKKGTSQVTVRVPLRTPYSCVLDGIQSTTKCTIGNQKLKVQDSPKEITAQFRTQCSDETLIISANPKIIRKIENEFSRGTTNEELAEKMASTPENQVFKLKKM